MARAQARRRRSSAGQTPCAPPSTSAIRSSPRATPAAHLAASRSTSPGTPGAGCLAVELVTFESAGRVTEAVAARQVDLAFVAIDPVRAADMDYTAPYVIIEGTYLVRSGSALQRNEEVDRAGTRVAVGRGSAYDLHLTRELKAATLVRAPTSPAVTDLFLAQGLEVAAGVRQQLEADAARVPGVRLLPGRFMVIEQAMAVPKGRRATQAWLAGFVEEAKASGFVAEALRRHGIEGAAVAPAASGGPRPTAAPPAAR